MRRWFTEEIQAQEASLEEAAAETVAKVDTQKLDARHTLVLNAINTEDYDTAKEYLNICFAYCGPQNNPEMYPICC